MAKNDYIQSFHFKQVTEAIAQAKKIAYGLDWGSCPGYSDPLKHVVAEVFMALFYVTASGHHQCRLHRILDCPEAPGHPHIDDTVYLFIPFRPYHISIGRGIPDFEQKNVMCPDCSTSYKFPEEYFCPICGDGSGA